MDLHDRLLLLRACSACLRSAASIRSELHEATSRLEPDVAAKLPRALLQSANDGNALSKELQSACAVTDSGLRHLLVSAVSSGELGVELEVLADQLGGAMAISRPVMDGIKEGSLIPVTSASSNPEPASNLVAAELADLENEDAERRTPAHLILILPTFTGATKGLVQAVLQKCFNFGLQPPLDLLLEAVSSFLKPGCKAALDRAELLPVVCEVFANSRQRVALEVSESGRPFIAQESRGSSFHAEEKPSAAVLRLRQIAVQGLTAQKGLKASFRTRAGLLLGLLGVLSKGAQPGLSEELFQPAGASALLWALEQSVDDIPSLPAGLAKSPERHPAPAPSAESQSPEEVPDADTKALFQPTTPTTPTAPKMLTAAATPGPVVPGLVQHAAVADSKAQEMAPGNKGELKNSAEAASDKDPESQRGDVKTNFVQCFKSDIFQDRQLLMSQINNLFKLRNNGESVGYKEAGYEKLQDLLLDIPGLTLSGAGNKMLVKAEDMGKFQAYCDDLLQGRDDLPSFDLPEPVPESFSLKVIEVFRKAGTREIPAKTFRDVWNRFLPHEKLQCKDFGYRDVKGLLANVDVVEKVGGKNATKYVLRADIELNPSGSQDQAWAGKPMQLGLPQSVEIDKMARTPLSFSEAMTPAIIPMSTSSSPSNIGDLQRPWEVQGAGRWMAGQEAGPVTPGSEGVCLFPNEADRTNNSLRNFGGYHSQQLQHGFDQSQQYSRNQGQGPEEDWRIQQCLSQLDANHLKGSSGRAIANENPSYVGGGPLQQQQQQRQYMLQQETLPPSATMQVQQGMHPQDQMLLQPVHGQQSQQQQRQHHPQFYNNDFHQQQMQQQQPRQQQQQQEHQGHWEPLHQSQMQQQQYRQMHQPQLPLQQQRQEQFQNFQPRMLPYQQQEQLQQQMAYKYPQSSSAPQNPSWQQQAQAQPQQPLLPQHQQQQQQQHQPLQHELQHQQPPQHEHQHHQQPQHQQPQQQSLQFMRPDSRQHSPQLFAPLPLQKHSSHLHEEQQEQQEEQEQQQQSGSLPQTASHQEGHDAVSLKGGLQPAWLTGQPEENLEETISADDEGAPLEHSMDLLLQGVVSGGLQPVAASRSSTGTANSNMPSNHDSQDEERAKKAGSWPPAPGLEEQVSTASGSTGLDDGANKTLTDRKARRLMRPWMNAQNFVSSPAAAGHAGAVGSEMHPGKFDMASLYQGHISTDRNCLVVDFTTGKVLFSNIRCEQLFGSVALLHREVADLVIASERHNLWVNMLYMGIGTFSAMDRSQYTIITEAGTRPAMISGEKLVGPLWWLDFEPVEGIEPTPLQPEEMHAADSREGPATAMASVPETSQNKIIL